MVKTAKEVLLLFVVSYWQIVNGFYLRENIVDFILFTID